MPEANARGPVVACAAYAHGTRVADVAIEDISEVLTYQDRFVWIGLYEPDEALLKQVQAEFGLHDLAIEDAHLAHQRPKLERYGDSLFIALRTAQTDRQQRRIAFGETHLFVGARYVVSVRHGASLSYADVRTRCEAAPHLLAKGPGFVLHAIMDFVVDQYLPIVDALEDDVETLEADIFGGHASRDTTMRIYTLKRDLLELKRGVSPLVDICNRLMRSDLDLIPDDARPYFRDVYDHAIRVNEKVDNLRELLGAALEANLTLTTIAQNEATKRITGWAAIFAIPTMIAGVYGMNFEFMPELHWQWGYPTVMGVTVLLCGVLYYRFKRSGWL
ncbi:MAG TPA: magnesium/cobalt transporter CorA [Methylomirabilota bacterium]|nr:magnesium/cobalt transporter CorA [Methylomirabilota bacterium]